MMSPLAMAAKKHHTDVKAFQYIQYDTTEPRKITTPLTAIILCDESMSESDVAAG
jgi:hypothetical protein